MAKNNIKGILRASFLAIGLGICVIIISMILQLLVIVASDSIGQTYFSVEITESIVNNVRFINTIFGILVFPLFLVLYFWTGMRAVKKYGLDAIGGASAAAFAYVVSGFGQLMLATVLNLVIMTKVIGGMAFGSTEAIIAANLFDDVSGMTGLGISAICGIGLILLGAMVVFVIGGIGGLFAARKGKRS
ncbi:hypothetical protein KKF81_04055 [Candidatus Micrarchaeota archaeon]|nr:hypothetical protein [Candidatus Micrarchaeota archaeon]MBU1166098.1 hypothetical protein [Candidatus Micrarchaeota archaeon]MBU1887165.1 hypothetical protein [Candidatus Micrarchaeota archaeon]